jgi:hypothetical protein
MNELDRVKLLIKHLIAYGFAENQKGVGVLLGYNTESSFSQIINGKVKTPKNFINKLKNIEPRLNINWLETGTGSMLLDSSTDTDTKSNAKPIMISELNVTIAPLIGQYAQAGYLCGFADKEYLDKQPMYVATQKYSGGNYVAFEIRGDSMDNDRRNAICNGDVVLGRELYQHYWTAKLHIPKVFIIVHQTEGILLKEIIDHDVERGIITCHSYNPDKERYPDFELHLKDIQQLFYMKELRRGND